VAASCIPSGGAGRSRRTTTLLTTPLLTTAPLTTTLLPTILLAIFLAIPALLAGCGGAEESDGTAAATGSAAPPTHPYQLAPLRADATFPRFTATELRSAGYPDHHHAYEWSGYEPPRDAAGETYGPRSICQGTTLIPRDGVHIAEGEVGWGQTRILYDPRFPPCAVLPFAEFVDLALRDVQTWLELTRTDTLTVEHPNNPDDYLARIGYGIWRLYGWEGSRVVVQPIPILFARTLVGHAAYQVTVDWVLRGHGGENLPAWLRVGLAEYLSEDGVHLANYMNEFRVEGAVLMDPARADSILAGPPHQEIMRDRQLFRQAAYTAFLMTWELVENRGGLVALRRFLHAVAAGTAVDVASREVYGEDLAGLAARLDPRLREEPIAPATQSRRPQAPPDDWSGTTP